MDTNCCWVGYVVYSNGSSSEGGQKGSSAVAVSRRGLSPTPRPANVADDDGLSSSGGWGNINVECNTVPASTGQKIIVGGDVLEVKEPTPKTTAAAKATGTNNTQSPAAPAAVDNAVNAAGGTSAVSEPTNIEADPPSTADARNAAGASSAVAESAPAAPVIEDAKLVASNAAAINATTAVVQSKIP